MGLSIAGDGNTETKDGCIDDADAAGGDECSIVVDAGKSGRNKAVLLCYSRFLRSLFCSSCRCYSFCG